MDAVGPYTVLAVDTSSFMALGNALLTVHVQTIAGSIVDYTWTTNAVTGDLEFYIAANPNYSHITGWTCARIGWITATGSGQPPEVINMERSTVVEGYLYIFAYLDGAPVPALYSVGGKTGTTGDVPVTLEVGTYDVTVTYGTHTETKPVTIYEGVSSQVNFNFTSTPSYSNVTIIISPQGSGITIPATGNYPAAYLVGSNLTINAIPAAGWKYVKMRRNGTDWTTSDPGEFLNLASIENIEIVFEQETGTEYSNVTITVTGKGTTTPAAGNYQTTYKIGDTLYVQAHAAVGYKYVNMKRNGLNHTASTYGEFLNLAAVESIEVVFKKMTSTSLAGPLGIWSFPGITRLSSSYTQIATRVETLLSRERLQKLLSRFK